jgi:S-adenosylmethionine hydrolase
MKIITFLSDFGTKDSYVSQMKAVASTITNARLMDITHEITPHNIREGAYALRCAAPYFPIGTVHVAVVDPGVGTNRRGILITTSKQILIGPDNGLLMPTAHFLGDYVIYEISNQKYMLNSISSTFHGRDIFTPVAANITNGIPFDEIGMRTNEYVNLDFGQGEFKENALVGKVINIDRFGNIITNLNKELILNSLSYNNKILVCIGEKNLRIPFVKSYGYVKNREVLATIGSGDFLEIGINQGNAVKKLSIKEEDKIEILVG